MFILISDHLNGITQIGLDIRPIGEQETWRVSLAFAFIIVPVLYSIFGLLYILLTCYLSYTNGCCYSPGLLKCLEVIVTFIGSLLYFFGDNLPKLAELKPGANIEQYGVTQLILLVSAFLFYRIIPVILHQMQKYCEVRQKSGKYGGKKCITFIAKP